MKPDGAHSIRFSKQFAQEFKSSTPATQSKQDSESRLFRRTGQIAPIADDSETVATVLQPFVDEHELTGAVVLVADKDKVLAVESVGFADIAGQRPMAAVSVFWIASQTKPMTAAAVMKDTTFWPNEELAAHVARSYRPNAEKTGLEEFAISHLIYPLTNRAYRFPMPAGGHPRHPWLKIRFDG